MKIISKAILLSFICSVAVNASDEKITLSKQQVSNLGVKLGTLQVIQQIPVLYAPAKVVIPPSREYIVSASQAGLLAKLKVAVGDKVEKGQLLARINSPDLLSLQRQYLKLHSERRLAKATVGRDKKLFEEGVISDRRWQESLSRYNGLVSELNEAQQLLEIAGKSKKDINLLAKTRRLSSQMNILSPISGVVLERMVVAGERIDILAPLYRIANLELLWLEIHVPQEKMHGIKLSDQVIIDNTKVKAHISLLGQSVNPVNQTVLVRAVIDSQQTSIRSGQTVNTQIIQSSEIPAFKVPNAAVAQSEGQAVIFVRDEQGFTVRPVTVIGKEGNDSIISGNLLTGETIAIRGAVALKANWLGLGMDE